MSLPRGAMVAWPFPASPWKKNLSGVLLGFASGAVEHGAVQWELAGTYRELNQPERSLAALHALADSYPKLPVLPLSLIKSMYIISFGILQRLYRR